MTEALSHKQATSASEGVSARGFKALPKFLQTTVKVFGGLIVLGALAGLTEAGLATIQPSP